MLRGCDGIRMSKGPKPCFKSMPDDLSVRFSGARDNEVRSALKKGKSRASLTLLSFESRGAVFFPCGSLFYWNEPGQKRCTNIRELIKTVVYL